MRYTELMDAIDTLKRIKNIFEAAILTKEFNGNTYPDGSKAKEALIRSQQLINLLHNLVKSQLISEGVDASLIHPPLNHTKPEVSIKGFLKSKNQDICVVEPTGEINDRVLSVNVRSQLSSMQKNIDTLYERTFAEALNLHLKYPAQCLGEVYLIPTHEYDDKAMALSRVEFKSLSKLETYIKMFQAINKRENTSADEYKYERVALMIVDFRKNSPKIYSSVDDLKRDGHLPAKSLVSLEGLDFDSFSKDLLTIYTERFGAELFT